MKPETWNNLLMAYLTGTLSERDRADFERTLADCEPCRAELAEWQIIAAAVRADNDARVETLLPLPQAFYQRLNAQPSANGSQSGLRQETEKYMTTITGNLSNEQRTSSKPLTLAAAVFALLALGALLLIGSGQGGPSPAQEMPNAGVVEQDASATPRSDLDPVILTATQISVDATGTQAVEDDVWTPAPNVTETFTATPSATASATFVPTPTPAASQTPFVITATPLPVEAFGIAIPPTIVPPASSGMQPIVSAPAKLNASIELPEGTGAAEVLLSRDGNVVAVLSLGGMVYLFDTATLQQTKQFSPQDSTIAAMAYDSNRNLLALGSADGEVYLLDVNTGTQDAVVEGDGMVAALAFSPDNSQMAVVRNGGTLNTLWLYNLDTGGQAAILIFDLPLTNAAFNADGSQVIVGTLDGRVLVLDVNTN